MSPEEMEVALESLAITTLATMKQIFSESGFDDRRCTLTLYYFNSPPLVPATFFPGFENSCSKIAFYRCFPGKR